MTPNKITIEPRFVDEYFEQEVLNLIPTKVASSVLRNQVLRYGADKPYHDKIVSENIPEIFEQFRNFFDFDSVTINEYMKGQYIGWHIDSIEGGPEVVIISLLSAAKLDFRKGEKTLSLNIPRYSLTRFSDEIRTEWEHNTKATERRISIVFRNSKACG